MKSIVLLASALATLLLLTGCKTDSYQSEKIRYDAPPEPGQTTFKKRPRFQAPPEPGQTRFQQDTPDAPPEPGQSTFQGGTQDAPPEPGQSDFE